MRRKRRAEAKGSQVSSPCSASSRPETSATAASPRDRRAPRQSRLFSTPGPSARPYPSDSHFRTDMLSPLFRYTLLLQSGFFSLRTARRPTPPPLNCPSLFSFRIVLPAPITTSLHGVRHASFPPPPRAVQLVLTELEPSPESPRSSPVPRPLLLLLLEHRARTPARAWTQPPLTLEAAYPTPTHPTLPRAASGLWGVRNSGGAGEGGKPQLPHPLRGEVV